MTRPRSRGESAAERGLEARSPDGESDAQVTGSLHSHSPPEDGVAFPPQDAPLWVLALPIPAVRPRAA